MSSAFASAFHYSFFFYLGGEELNSNLYEVLVKNAYARHLGL